MVVTVAIVVFTHNLALGVLAGVLLSAIFFARRVAHVVEVTEVVDPDRNVRIYHVTGELFFASTNELVHSFDYFEETPDVIIDLTDAHIWDSSAVAVLDTIVAKFERHGTRAEITGLNVASNALHERLSGHLASSH
jgi:SulP family sulfate permease